MRGTEQVRLDQAAYERTEHGPGRPPDFEGRLAVAQQAENVAKEQMESAVADRDQAKDAIAEISETYHPFALTDGHVQTSERVAARRVLKRMIDTIRWVHDETATRIHALGLDEAVRRDVAERMVPGLYLEACARRAATADDRRKREAVAAALLAPLRAPEHPLQRLPEEQRRATWATSQECAELFQRSSSCVEGRNGQLSLHHHGTHRLPKRKLEALTVVHNYFARRSDGTTAAERFFATAPADLFEHLLAHVEPLRRPCGSRSRPSRVPRTPQTPPAELAPT